MSKKEKQKEKRFIEMFEAASKYITVFKSIGSPFLVRLKGFGVAPLELWVKGDITSDETKRFILSVIYDKIDCYRPEQGERWCLAMAHQLLSVDWFGEAVNE